MKYISLFSGIGGFEVAIHNMFSHAQCIGYSEVDKFAIQVYQHHYPTHQPLGSITEITEEQIKTLLDDTGGCDLVVGGFPCQNLTSLARQNRYGDSRGLNGPKSGLFWTMIQVIEWIQHYNTRQLHIIIENNASMKNEYKHTITTTLQSLFSYPVYMTKLNAGDFGVQTRRRLYWTTFEICHTDTIRCEQTWDDVLLPIEECMHHLVSERMIFNKGNKQFYKKKSNPVLIKKLFSGTYLFYIDETQSNMISNWQKSSHSDTCHTQTELHYKYNIGKCTPMLCQQNFEHILIDRRINDHPNEFIPRYFHPIEVERLFFLPDGYVSDLCSKTRSQKLLGNTVVVRVIEFMLQSIPASLRDDLRDDLHDDDS